MWIGNLASSSVEPVFITTKVSFASGNLLHGNLLFMIFPERDERCMPPKDPSGPNWICKRRSNAMHAKATAIDLWYARARIMIHELALRADCGIQRQRKIDSDTLCCVKQQVFKGVPVRLTDQMSLRRTIASSHKHNPCCNRQVKHPCLVNIKNALRIVRLLANDIGGIQERI